MRPNPLNHNPAPRATRNTESAESSARSSTELPPRPQAPTPDSAMGNSRYVAYHPGLARSQSGLDTPPSMSYARLDDAAESREQLLPKQNKGKAPARLGESASGDIALQDMSSKRKGKRKERPIDPMLQALTKPGPQREGKVPDTGLVDVSLTPPGGNSRRPSTDDMGMPMPGQTGPLFPDAIREEEKAIQGKNKKAAIASAVALATVTVVGATISTLKNQGKI